MKKAKILRLRRSSYFDIVWKDAESWYITKYKKTQYCPVDSREFVVSAFLKATYGLTFSSTSMRTLVGEHLNKKTKSFCTRVDYYRYTDNKQLLFFNLKYTPVVIQKNWYYKHEN